MNTFETIYRKARELTLDRDCEFKLYNNFVKQFTDENSSFALSWKWNVAQNSGVNKENGGKHIKELLRDVYYAFNCQ
jgi:hypothetical protein